MLIDTPHRTIAKKIKEAMEGKEMYHENQELLDSLNKPPSFDEFIKQIKTCDNLLDALRIRDTINTEIMKKKTEIGI
jgi:hypothetical protein